MFTRADLVDIYSMADPTKCSKYIVVASDALDALFVKIRLNPMATKEGTLYFQSIDGLTKGTTAASAGAKALRIKYCKQIAFFFVRIFQTFAALTLTILDSELPLIDPRDELPEETGRQRRVEFIDPRSFLGVSQAAAAPQSRGFFSGGVQKGGALRGNFVIPGDSAYSVLNSWLTSNINSTERNPIPFKNSSFLRVIQNSLYDLTPDSGPVIERTAKDEVTINNKDNQGIQLYYITKRGDTEIQIESFFKLIRDDANTLRVDLKIASIINPPTMAQPINKTISFSMKIDSLYSEYLYKGREYGDDIYNKPIETILKAIFEREVRSKIGLEKMNIFEILRKYGYLQVTSSRGGNDIYTIRGTNDVKFLMDKDPKMITKLNLSYRTDEFTVPEEKKRITLEIYNILIENVQNNVDESGAGQKIYTISLDFSSAKIKTSPGGYESYITLPSAAYRTLPFTERTAGTEPLDQYGRSIPIYIRKKLDEIITNKGEDLPDGTGIQYTRQGFPVPYNSDALGEGFRVKAIWKALVKDPPVKSHCVARATQLLSVAAIRGKVDGDTFSSICRTKFLYQKDGSLPTPGEGIFHAASDVGKGKLFQGEFGILALTTLFFDRLGDTGIQLADMTKYKTFLANLKFAFEKAAAPEYTNPPNRIDEIREKIPAGCRAIGDDARIAISRPLANDLRGVTQQLMSQQMAHVERAMTLIFELFDKDAIINRRQFALNPKILAGGTPAVNAVAQAARDLLLKYYVDCETTYRQGLSYIVRAGPLKPYDSTATTTVKP